MGVFVNLLLKETRWLWRSYRLAALIGVFLILGLGSPLLVYFLPDLIEAGGQDIIVTLPEFTSADALAEFLNNLTQMGTIGVILVAMGAVAGERASGSAVFTVSKPVGFLNFVVAKFVVLAVLIMAATIIGAAAAFAYTVVLFGAPDLPRFLAATGLTMLLLIVMLSITLVGSCIGRSQLLAGAVGLAAFILLGVFGAVPLISGYSPFGLSSWAADIVRREPGGAAWPALVASIAIVALGPPGARLLTSRDL